MGLHKIYPNPASAITVIPILSNKTQEVSIELIDMQGAKVKIIYNGVIYPGEKNFFIDASQFASGMYNVVIESEEFKQVQKLIIE